MRPPKIIAPLAVLILLTSACGIFTHHTGKPAAKPVWKIANGTLDSAEASVVGDTVIANVLKKRGGDDPSDTAVFIDARTGRIRGRATDLIVFRNMGPETSEHGRPLLGTPAGSADEVYDPSGHLVWQAPGSTDEQFVGGYTAERRKSAGKYWEVIRTASGRVITRLPEPKGETNPEWDDAEPQLQAVRPGLLAAIGLGPSGSRATLIDVSRPGHARLRPLRPPPTSSDHSRISPQEMAVGSGHLYVSWGSPARDGKPHARYLAGYDVPDAHLAWHTSLPISGILYEVQASTSGEGTLAVEGHPGDAGPEQVWFLRPDTGALIDPKQGRGGVLPLQGPGLVGGRAYATTNTGTQVIDPRTGSVVRTIPDPGDQRLLGVSSSGDLIYAGKSGLYSYR